MDFTAELQVNLQKLGLEVPESAAVKLNQLINLLQTWSRAINLTAIKDPRDMMILHVLDSAAVGPYLEGSHIADVGTGAGFPGLVLAVLYPERHFTLIDSVGKKLAFVRAAAAALKLDNVKVLHTRCEELRPNPPFDCVVSRAFAPLERMVQWCLPLISEKGCFTAMKADLKPEEVNAVPSSVKIERIVDLKVPLLNAARCAVILRRASAKDM